MNPIENELRELLNERAEEVAMPHARHAQTMGRARRRRALTGASAMVAALALVAGGVTLAGDLGMDERGPKPARESDDGYDFTAAPGDFPVVAEGEFRDGTWELRGTPEELAPGVDQIRLKLTVTRGSASRSTTNVVQPSDDTLLAVHDDLAGLFDDGAGVVFGATTPAVAAVDVELARGGGDTLPAYLVTDYDSRSTITASYYVAFVPRDVRGWVVARDGVGVDLEREPLGEVPDDPGVLATGKTGDVTWALEAGRRGNRVCLHATTGMDYDDCFTEEDLRGEAPMLLRVHETEAVKHVTGVLTEPWTVRLKLRGQKPVVLQRFDLTIEMLPRWLRHVVVVGLEPGTSGRLQVLDDRGEVVMRRPF